MEKLSFVILGHQSKPMEKFTFEFKVKQSVSVTERYTLIIKHAEKSEKYSLLMLQRCIFRCITHITYTTMRMVNQVIIIKVGITNVVTCDFVEFHHKINISSSVFGVSRCCKVYLPKPICHFLVFSYKSLIRIHRFFAVILI